GADEDVVLDHAEGREVDVGLDLAPRADHHVFVDRGAAADDRLRADHRALADLGLVADDRLVADHRARVDDRARSHRDAYADAERRQCTTPRCGSSCQPRDLAEERAPLDHRRLAYSRPVLDDDVRSEQHAVPEMDVVAEDQPPRLVCRPRHRPGPQAPIRATPARRLSSSEFCKRSSTRTTRNPLSPSETGVRPSRTQPRKCSHSRRSGSAVGTRRGQMSPERVMYSPYEFAFSSNPLSYTVTFRSRSMSSNVAIRFAPTTVKRRSLCGSSHDRCRCAAMPDGKRMNANTTSSTPSRM